MNDHPPRDRSRIAAWLAIAVGATVLLGWIVDSPTLKGAIGVPITMKANSAVCLVLCGLSLLAVSRSRSPTLAGKLPALVAALVGALTLLEHASGRDLGIDQRLFHEPWGEPATSSPGRMGLPASTSFLLLGLGLAFIDWRTAGGRHPFRWLPVGPIAIALVSIVGYALRLPSLYSAATTTGIAWPTTVALLVLGCGAIAARPDNVLVRTLTGPELGSSAARRLLGPSIAIPFVLMLVYGAIRDREWIDATTGRGVLAVAMMLALTSLVLLTAHRLNAMAARQSRVEREFEDFFENSSVAMHWAGPDGTILRANRAELELLGYRREEYVGRPIADFHVDRHVVDDVLRRLHAHELLHDHPVRLRCKDGSIKEAMVDSSVLWDGDRFLHTRCFTRDVTGRRQDELASRRLSAIVESSNDAIVGKNLDGVVTSWNRAAEQMFGYTAAEMIGKSIAILIPPDRSDEERRILESIRRGEPVELFEAVRVRKDGQTIQVSLSISPIRDAHGQVVGASKIARDITEKKRIEVEREALLARERMARVEAEEATRSRDEFLAVVSHELRTPLNTILGWSQVMRRSRPEERNLVDAILAIERAARAQLRLVEDLLDTNRIIRGRIAIDPVPVELRHVVELAIANLRPSAESKGQQIGAAFDGDVGSVLGDASRLDQVVSNLLSNAIKFTPPGGAIDVRLRRAGAQVELEVTDSGIGIDPKFLPHVFERFRQADASTTRAHGGLGLGLSIVSHLVQLHGGTVAVHSDGLGHGATFSVRLPLATPGQEASARSLPVLAANAGVPPTVDLRGVRILVVDDDAESRELVSRILASCNAEIRTAGSAAEGLALLAEREFDVLISDIGMPQMDGYQFIQSVRKLPPPGRRNIPAVAMTAYARSEDRTRAMLAGYQMHVAKPIEPQELVATVASITGRMPT